jgi:hypothetical protein
VIKIADKWDPEFLITGTATLLPDDPLKYLNDLSMAFPARKVLVSGTLAAIAAGTGMKNIIAVRSSADLKSNMSGSSSSGQQ